MIFKHQQNLTDDFVSIHDLRKKNKLKVNYFKAEQKNKSIAGQANNSIDLNSQWDKVKTYFVDLVENMISEPIEVSDQYSKPNLNNRNLMVAIDSGPEISYGLVNLGRIQSNIRLFLIINSVLKKLEHFFRNIQVGFILDAETLEFNDESCDHYLDEHLPEAMEVLWSTVQYEQKPNLGATPIKCEGRFNKSIKKVLNSLAAIFKPTEESSLEYFPFSIPKDNGGGNDP